jgi:Ca2+-binding EF-hand superfamily protein
MRSTRHATILAALALFGCGANGGRGETVAERGPVEHPSFAEVDRDGDGTLGREELFGATVELFDELDMDQDGRLTPRELSDGLYRVWDLDRNGRLERPELEQGLARLGSASHEGFERWDRDDNDWVDRAEFRRGMERTAIFARFDEDGDGRVTDLELSDGLFRSWDTDGDGAVTRSEWRWG